MLCQRTPLKPIPSNIIPHHELTPYQRGQIAGAKAAGARVCDIVTATSRSKSTVLSTLRQADVRLEGLSKPRSGRPRLYSDRVKRNLIRHCRLHPEHTYTQVRKAIDSEISTSSITRILGEVGIGNWKAKKRPFLTPEIAAIRLQWCKARAHWTVEDWKKYMWSDECSIERGRGKQQEWVFRTPIQKWAPEMVQTYGTGKDIKTMVWGCFWGDGRSSLHILDRDFESKKHGYSANSYIEVLDAGLAQHYQEDLVFMQDNAPIHTARKVKDWFKEQEVRTTDWPPYSPDLNPIEHLWWELKKKVFHDYPELLRGGKGEEDIGALEEACKEAWKVLPQELLDSLIGSMTKRIETCITAKGWHTKY